MISIRGRATAILLLITGLCVCSLVSVWVGAVAIEWRQLLALMLEPLLGESHSVSAMERSVFWVIRAPRVVGAVLVGGALAISGAALQGIFRNPLADPGLIGVSSGAAVFVVGWIVFGATLSLPIGRWTIPIVAFAGAISTTWLVARLSTRDGRIDMASMLLAGIAINAMAGALIGFATYMADDAQLRTLTLWSLGSLAGIGWREVGLFALFMAPGLFVLMRQSRALDLMLLGEREAMHSGVDTARVRTKIVAASAAIVGVSVGFVGVIGFIGLVVPHLIRLSGGATHRWVLPGSLLGGALLLLVADTCARTMAAPAELPIGVLTAAIGAPFFLGLLTEQKRGRG